MHRRCKGCNYVGPESKGYSIQGSAYRAYCKLCESPIFARAAMQRARGLLDKLETVAGCPIKRVLIVGKR